MTHKILSILSGTLVIVSCSGCSEPRVEIQYIDRPVEVLVPVKCTVPDVECNWSGSDVEVVAGMFKCIVDQKMASKVCQ